MKLVFDALWSAVQITSGMLPRGEVCVEREGGKGVRDEMSEGEKSTKKHAEKTAAKQKTTAARKLEFGKSDKECDEDETKDQTTECLPNSAPSSREQLYTTEVLDRLHEAKTCLSLLYPLNFRLEILENILSLLFLTSEDVRAVTQPEALRHSSFTSGGRHDSTCSSNGPEGSLNLRPPSFRRHSDGEFSAALSSVALIRSRHGFLIGERVAGDLLGVLQDSMHEMRAARYVLTQSSAGVTTATLQPEAIQCSVSATSAQQRSAKLEQYINEARWRLQLVSSRHGVGVGQVGGVSADEISSSGAESGSEVSDSESEREKEREIKRRQVRKVSSAPQEGSRPPGSLVTPEIEVAPLISGPPSTILSSRSVLIGRVSPSPPPQSPTWGIPSPKPSLRSSIRYRSPKLSPGATGNNFTNEADPLRHRRHRRSRSPCPPPSDPSPLSAPQPEGAMDSGECADVDEDSPQRLGRKKKRFRSRTLQAAKKRRMKINEWAESGNAHGGVVSQMLSSPESLLRMCLRHGNASRAHEVLRVFKMEGQFGEEFVKFSEKYQSVCRELGEQGRLSLTPKSSPSQTPQEKKFHHKRSPSSCSSNSTTMLLHPDTHLHVAIANATSSSSILESLHHLLAPSSLPRMLLSGDETLEKTAKDSPTLQILAQHVPSLVMLDLISSSRAEGQVVRRIIEEASSRCQSVLESLSIKPRSGKRRFSSSGKKPLPHEVNLPGPFSLLQFLSEVSGYFSSLPPPSGVTSPYHSPHSLFSVFLRPLRTASVMGCKTFLDSYQIARETLSGQFDQDASVGGDIVSTLTQSTVPMEEPQRSLSHALRKSNLSESLFRELVVVMEGLSSRPPVTAGLPRLRGTMRWTSSVLLTTGASSPEGERVGTNFVRQFSQYLSQFVELLLKCLSPSTAGVCVPVCVCARAMYGIYHIPYAHVCVCNTV